MLNGGKKNSLHGHCLLWRFSLGVLTTILSAQMVAAVETDNRIKTAFLYHFCSYIQWPDNTFLSPTSPLVIAIAAHTEVVAELRTFMSPRHCGKHPIQVEAFTLGKSWDGVHIFYIPQGSKQTIQDFIQQDNSLPILTVTDVNTMSPLSIINFVIVDQRVRFDISARRANDVGLKLRSELLSVARTLYTDTPQ